LLFRGLSFWLPMLPGYWSSRRARMPRARLLRESTPTAYWALEPSALAQRMGSGPEGLSATEAATRLGQHGPNALRERRRLSRLDVLVRQVRSPLMLLLVFAAGAAALTGEWLDATIVGTIVIVTAGIGYSREYSAQAAAARLLSHLVARATVLRDGHAHSISPPKRSCLATSSSSRLAASYQRMP
jgi:P-type Mg2+ transporter